MRILFLLPNVPPTRRVPGSPRLYDLLRGLRARKHSLALVCGVTDRERWREFLEQDGGAELLERTYPLFAAPHLQTRGRVRNLLSPRPAFDTRYRAPAYYAQMRARVTRALQEFAPHILHVDQLAMAQYVPDARQCAFVMDPHDAISLTEARKLTLNHLTLPQRALQLYQARKIKHYEYAVAARADAYVVNAAPDREYLQTFLPREKLHLIPNCVDTTFYHPAPEISPQLQIVFTAAFANIYNVDAVTYFYANIWPRVRAALPNVRWSIVGAAPPAAVQALARDPLITVTGFVPDVRPYIWESEVVISPLRGGTGLKNKLLNAMAMAKAIVATPTSAEGLGVHNQEQLLLAESDTAFAEAIAQVMNDAGLAQRLGAAGREFVVREYSCANFAARFESLYVNLLRK